MNLLLPEHVINAVIERLEDNIEDLSYKGNSIQTIKQITAIPQTLQSTHEMGFKPPWLGVYFYEGEADDIAENGEAFNLEKIVGVLCSSSHNYKNPSDAVNECQFYAQMVHKILLTDDTDFNTYTVNISFDEIPDNKLVRLSSHKLPREVILATASLSLCVARFTYQHQE